MINKINHEDLCLSNLNYHILITGMHHFQLETIVLILKIEQFLSKQKSLIYL
jgi:hypothetical protein